jgi:predicted nuclease of predicted toxin-antitoxin system
VRFVADESCDFAVVRALRAAGHDVTAIAEVSPRAEDEDVMTLALQEHRMLLTEDKDFGRLVHAGRPAAPGVLLLRFGARARTGMATTVVELVKQRGADLAGRFVVVTPGRVRIGRGRGA